MEDMKGTVTPLASLMSAEEAQRAIKHVEDAIAGKQQELDQLHHFISDNNNLFKLVQRLPDELSHDIMVPFGKAAFFPGRLIHTNEFLVLLGEGYYAERTSKQTVDILQRRGKMLDSQVDSLKAVMMDLKAEASFFENAAAESNEGLMEITENYSEELLDERMPNPAGLAKSDLVVFSEEANMKGTDDEEEFARIMARLDELEREELAAESVNKSDDDEDTDMGCSISQNYLDKSLKISEDLLPKGPPKMLENKNLRNKSTKALTGDHLRKNYPDDPAVDLSLKNKLLKSLTFQKSLCCNLNLETRPLPAPLLSTLVASKIIH